MSLGEIESVVDQLSLAEQEELLRHLETTLRNKRGKSASESREDWMRRLEKLRASIGSGTPSLRGEEILTELRGD